MPWQMPFTDDNDNVYNQSYWKLAVIDMCDFNEKRARFVFFGWKSQNAKQNNKPPVGKHVYFLQDAMFDQYTQNKQNGVSIDAYGASAAILDVLVTPAIVDGMGNIITPAVYKSFFDGAVAV